MIDSHAELADVKEHSPGVIKAIKKYSATIERKIDVCEWNPAECEYACGDMYIFWKVKKKKKEFWEQFIKFKEQDWSAIAPQEKESLIEKIGVGLAEYLTKLTDYIADEKHQKKDMSIAREYLEPFKWDNILVYKTLLGNGAGLLSNTLESPKFWKTLKVAHKTLKGKYPCSDEIDAQLGAEIDRVNGLIVEQWSEIVDIKMPYDMASLWDKDSIITYATELGEQLRESDSLEENASFLVRWAAELFGEWATWL